MAFKWISQWINGDSQSARQRSRKPRARPRLEELEPRVVLSDYYLVRGSSANMTSVLFHYNNNGGSSTTFHDEIGVYKVGDDLGDVGTTKPTDSGYLAAALASGNATPLFTPSSPVGTDNVVKFLGDTLLGFYIVQNGTSAQALADNATDTLSSGGHVTFFSFQGANPDSTRHAESALYGDGSAVIDLSDQTDGGTGNFPIQLTVGVAGGSGDSLTGQPGQTVPVTFNLTSRGSNTDELGIFSVDAPDGQIGGLMPGAPGWVSAALSSTNQHVIFTGSQGAGATTTVNLPGGGLFGFYMVQDDTTADQLANNASDVSGQKPVAFFSFVGASPDQFQHLRWTNMNSFTWDDQTGGGNQEFTGLTGTVSYGTPTGTAVTPVTITPSTLPADTSQVAYNQTLTASGGNGTKTFAVTSGNLPTGLSLSSSGLLTGTPTTSGTSNFTVTATDTQGTKGSQAYSLVVNAPITLSPTTLPTGTVNTIFNQSLTANGGTGSKTFTSTGTLPPGVSLSTAGLLTGTPTTAGSFTFTVTATDSLNAKGSQAYTATINAAPPFQFQAPTVTSQIQPVSVAQNAAPMTIDLAAHFGDPDIVDGNTTVTMNTSSGPINLTLFDASAPQTVANFVDYAQNSLYNSSIIHRIANLGSAATPAFIVQGGGFSLSTSPTTSINTITAGPQIQNEFNATNPDVAGTIAMAKQSGAPNSATDEWFFNVGDNSQTLGAGNNGGFTVFGKLADSTTSQTNLNTLSQIPTFNEASSGGSGASASVRGALGQIPLTTFTGGNNDPNFPNDTTAANYALVSGVTVSQKDALTYSIVSNSNSSLVTPTFVANHGEQLTLTFAAGQTGTASIVIKATNKNGQTVTQTIQVTVT